MVAKMDLEEKIGTINFHRAINYGAVLQAYALNESIKKLGGNPVTLDYKNPHIEKLYDPNNINYKNFKGFISSLLTYNRKKKKKQAFERFREKYLTSYNANNLETLETANFKCFITGSDQVWNYNMTQFDKAYFLDFVTDSSKKNSYAASFGFECIPDEYLEEYKKLLENFNNISVREEQGAVIINDLLGRQVESVLDPTMLLSLDDWSNISQIHKNQEDYILIYTLATSQTLFDFAANLAHKTNCKIIYISDALRKRIKATYAIGVSPEEFLGLFKDAKYIITNSFHGTAFSINFNKPFFVEMLPPPAIVNSRLENILDIFDLRSRKIINGNSDNIFKDIDYTAVNEKLEIERQKSLDFLKRILEV